MNRKYLIRLDDACPTMERDNWRRIEEILDRHGVKPMVGVIPDNRDPQQQLSPADEGFWPHVKEWEAKGWAIAMHGYDHCYISMSAGINPLWPRSEFAGVSLDEQRAKIRNGMAIFRQHGIEPRYFFAPSHTFDLNTLEALRRESTIRIISDTIATRPYRRWGFTFLPQMGGSCREMRLPGVWTFCLHPSAMRDADFDATDRFLTAHAAEFTSFDRLSLDRLGGKSLMGHLLSTIYFTRRRLRR